MCAFVRARVCVCVSPKVGSVILHSPNRTDDITGSTFVKWLRQNGCDFFPDTRVKQFSVTLENASSVTVLL